MDELSSLNKLLQTITAPNGGAVHGNKLVERFNFKTYYTNYNIISGISKSITVNARECDSGIRLIVPISNHEKSLMRIVILQNKC